MLTRITKRASDGRTGNRAEKRAERTGRDGVGETRVELWREATRTGGRNEFERVADSLRALVERGDVDEAAVETWDRYVDVSGGYPDDEIPRATLDRIGQLQRWAWRRGEDSPFTSESRTVGRGRMGPQSEVRRVPRAALVEFENGVVTNVTFADERCGCLTDRLRALARRERAATERRRDDDPLERLFS